METLSFILKDVVSDRHSGIEIGTLGVDLCPRVVRVKACGYGDDLRCMGCSREEAQGCVDVGSAVFHFFGLEASPKKMWVRRLKFDEKGVLMEVVTFWAYQGAS